MEKQEGFSFIERADESQKNAIVISRITDPKVPDPDFESLSWVLRARSKDHKRLFLCGLFSDGQGQFISTDGHRMHIADIPALTERIPAGLWIYVHSDKKQISIKEAPEGTPNFPDYKRIYDLSERHKKRGVLSYHDDTMAVWDYWNLTGVRSNINYLLDICRVGDDLSVFSPDLPSPSTASGSPESEILPIFFCSDVTGGNTKKAILMPLK